jgi:anti-sigma regulatory factor (Ser/Thr protein kinase)
VPAGDPDKQDIDPGMGDPLISMLTVACAELPPEPASVPAAREVVAQAAGHLPRRAREAAELVASELATNSVVHARTPFEVFVAADEATVEIVVADSAGWAAPPEAGRRTGHGLLLVGLLATDWAAELEARGKKVWARLLVDDVPTY